uniref:Secreted protein n=1 Tax=Amphimedon queenslandica TaxID=400682 RepID=A0A1X7V751_AMPQE
MNNAHLAVIRCVLAYRVTWSIVMASSSGGRNSRESQPRLGEGSRSLGVSTHICDGAVGGSSHNGDSRRQCDEGGGGFDHCNRRQNECASSSSSDSRANRHRWDFDEGSSNFDNRGRR